MPAYELHISRDISIFMNDFLSSPVTLRFSSRLPNNRTVPALVLSVEHVRHGALPVVLPLNLGAAALFALA